VQLRDPMRAWSNGSRCKKTLCTKSLQKLGQCRQAIWFYQGFASSAFTFWEHL